MAEPENMSKDEPPKSSDKSTKSLAKKAEYKLELGAETIEEYIELRILNQRIWYEENASKNKSKFQFNQKTIIILGALIPIIVATESLSVQVGWQSSSVWSGYLSSIISALIAIVAGLDKLYKPQENWYNYRAVEETLKKEYWLYKFRVGHFSGLDPQQAGSLLIERTESLVASDIARFSSTQKGHINDDKTTLDKPSSPVN